MVGEAAIVTVGAGTTTRTSADCETAPPAPVQVRVKLVVAVRGSVLSVPLVGWVPDQPPEAVQLCAFRASHFNVTGFPMTTLLGIGCRVTTGGAPVPEFELGGKAFVWLQDARHANAAALIVQRPRHALRPTKLIVGLREKAFALPAALC